MENQILQQMEAYLKNNISKEECAQIIENYFDLYGNELKSSNLLFYQIFMDSIPDICLFYVYEPDTQEHKEREFRKHIELAYKELLKVM